MSAIGLALLDVVLALALLSLAWASLAGGDMRRSVFLFMGFGLVLALVWARLHAPDLALAEAAIGAGLSGALLLAAVREQPDHAESGRGTTASLPVRVLNVTIGLLSGALVLLLVRALYDITTTPPAQTLAEPIAANLDMTGVSNPVTAVLLNFRAYDTLLELAVLLTAVLGILALGPARSGYQRPGAVFEGLQHWLVPALVITAAYLLWVGAHAPGGAFQAGATLAAAGIVLRLAGQRHTALPRGIVLRSVLVAGIGVFALVGLAMMLAGGSFLEYPPALAGALILLIETAAMLSIAATLVLAFVGGRPQPPVAADVRRMHAPAGPGCAADSAAGDGVPQAERRPC